MSTSVRLRFLELMVGDKVGEERQAAYRQSWRKIKTKFAVRMPSNTP